MSRKENKSKIALFEKRSTDDEARVERETDNVSSIWSGIQR